MLGRVVAAWGTWRALDEARADPAALDALNHFGDFFGLTIHSVFASTFLGIYQLYDHKRSDVLTIPRLVKDAAEEPHARFSFPPDVSIQLSSALALIGKIAVPRHKLLGHRDYSMSWADVFEVAGVTEAEIDKIIQLTDDILVQVRRWHHSTYPDHSSAAPSDAKQLIEHLKNTVVG